MWTLRNCFDILGGKKRPTNTILLSPPCIPVSFLATVGMYDSKTSLAPMDNVSKHWMHSFEVMSASLISQLQLWSNVLWWKILWSDGTKIELFVHNDEELRLEEERVKLSNLITLPTVKHGDGSIMVMVEDDYYLQILPLHLKSPARCLNLVTVWCSYTPHSWLWMDKVG